MPRMSRTNPCANKLPINGVLWLGVIGSVLLWLSVAGSVVGCYGAGILLFSFLHVEPMHVSGCRAALILPSLIP